MSNNIFKFDNLYRKQFGEYKYVNEFGDDLLSVIVINSNNDRLFYTIMNNKKYEYKFYDLLLNKKFIKDKKLLLYIKNILNKRYEEGVEGGGQTRIVAKKFLLKYVKNHIDTINE